MEAEISIRTAGVHDLAEILRHRRGMYEDMGYTDSEALDRMQIAFSPYLSRALAEGSFRCWFAEIDGTVAGGGGILVSPWLAHPYDLECRRGTILNVYTHPQFRRRGVATMLMKTILAWCREQEFPVVWLHASDDGRPLYQKLGFEPTNEMRLKLR